MDATRGAHEPGGEPAAPGRWPKLRPTPAGSAYVLLVVADRDVRVHHGVHGGDPGRRAAGAPARSDPSQQRVGVLLVRTLVEWRRAGVQTPAGR